MNRRAAFAAMALLLACRPSESLKLPEAPDADLAFAILHDDNDRVQVVGDVVLRPTLYAGNYTVVAERGALRARIYFASSEQIRRTAEERCRQREDTSDRVRCLRAVDRCQTDPTQCIRPVKRNEPCRERLVMPPDTALIGFEAADDGRLLPMAEGAALPINASLCGPVTDSPCTNYVAGFIALRDDGFGCTVEVDQRGCSATLELDRCTLAPVDVEVAADGSLTVRDGSCSITRMGSSFALSCNGASYELVPQDRVIGRAECRRHGPAIFNTRVPTTGRITGGLVYQPPGWTAARDVLVGRGTDDCASVGCFLRGGSCNSECLDSCTQRFEISECALDDWAACVGVSQVEDCLRRCRTWCGRQSSDSCFVDARGDALTIAPIDAPEFEVARVDLDEGSNVGATGLQSLAKLDDDTLAIVTSDVLHMLVPRAPDTLVETTTAALAFEAAGVVTTASDVVVFGASLARYEWRNERLTLESVVPLTDITGARIVVGGGLDARSWFVAGSEPRVVVLDRTSLMPRGTFEVPGGVTTMVSAAEGLVVAIVDGGASIAILDESSELGRFNVWPGLRATALARDDLRCPREGATCALFVGFEETDRAANAMVGMFDLDTTDLERSTLASVLTPVSTQQVDLMLIDAPNDRVAAIASRRNAMSLILPAD